VLGQDRQFERAVARAGVLEVHQAHLAAVPQEVGQVGVAVPEHDAAARGQLTVDRAAGQPGGCVGGGAAHADVGAQLVTRGQGLPHLGHPDHRREFVQAGAQRARRQAGRVLVEQAQRPPLTGGLVAVPRPEPLDHDAAPGVDADVVRRARHGGD
jgi:hypothetical protein